MGDFINFSFWTLCYWIAIVHEVFLLKTAWEKKTKRKKTGNKLGRNPSSFWKKLVQLLRDQSEIHRFYIPVPSVILNLSWETATVFQGHPNWMNMVWFVSEILIFLITALHIRNKAFKALFLCAFPVVTILFVFLFQFESGKLISSFAIDLVMACLFLLLRERIAEEGRISIAVTKGIGDFGAFLHYCKMSPLIIFFGSIVTVINTVYLSWCVLHRRKKRI